MSVNYIEIDTEQLKRDMQELLNGEKNAESALQEMVQEVNELNTMWSGKANRAFRVQFSKDIELMSELLEKIKRLAECMEFASTEYVKCEVEVKDLVDNIKI